MCFKYIVLDKLFQLNLFKLNECMIIYYFVLNLVSACTCNFAYNFALI